MAANAMRSFSAVLLISGFMVNAMAVDIHVRVVSSQNRQALAAAAVCLGTPANPRQFGAAMSDAQGLVVFSDVPYTPLQLTVSKPGFQGQQSAHPAKGFNVVIDVSLPAGGLGPECQAEPADAAQGAALGLQIQSFTVNHGQAATTQQQVTLFSLVDGEPTEYRASEYADFADAEWLPYANAVKFQLSAPPGPKRVYFQVRRYRELGEASLQSVSEVSGATIRYK